METLGQSVKNDDSGDEDEYGDNDDDDVVLVVVAVVVLNHKVVEKCGFVHVIISHKNIQ